jgi:hypothetical protein
MRKPGIALPRRAGDAAVGGRLLPAGSDHAEIYEARALPAAKT